MGQWAQRPGWFWCVTPNETTKAAGGPVIPRGARPRVAAGHGFGGRRAVSPAAVLNTAGTRAATVCVLLFPRRLDARHREAALDDIRPIHVATYIEGFTVGISDPSLKGDRNVAFLLKGRPLPTPTQPMTHSPSPTTTRESKFHKRETQTKSAPKEGVRSAHPPGSLSAGGLPPVGGTGRIHQWALSKVPLLRAFAHQAEIPLPAPGAGLFSRGGGRVIRRAGRSRRRSGRCGCRRRVAGSTRRRGRGRRPHR